MCLQRAYAFTKNLLGNVYLKLNVKCDFCQSSTSLYILLFKQLEILYLLYIFYMLSMGPEMKQESQLFPFILCILLIFPFCLGLYKYYLFLLAVAFVWTSKDCLLTNTRIINKSFKHWQFISLGYGSHVHLFNLLLHNVRLHLSCFPSFFAGYVTGLFPC